jgi:serine phosphatase RsbU (regulator of sigma subunit)
MRESKPSCVLQAVNETMLRSEVDRFCTASYARIHLSPGRADISVARAGLPPVLVLRANGSVEEVKPQGALLGVFEEAVFAEESVELRAGDAFLIFTDGLVEGNTPPLTGERELAGVLERWAGLSAEGITERLSSALGHPERPSTDDIVVLAGRVRPAQESDR